MTTKPSNIGQWIGAVIAAVVIIGASFLGFHAFNARAHANAELQSGAQSPQSDNTAQSGSQSGDTLQSTEPTPVNIPKPTPPPHLCAGGQIGAQATSQWYIDLWAYAFNTGDTEDFMKVCQVAGYCDEFAHDLERMHTDSYLITPLTNKYLQTNAIYKCSLQRAGTKGICIEFTYLQTPATFGYLTVEKASEQYDTISTVTGEEINNEQRFFRVLFLEERGDTWVVTHIWDH